MDLECTQGVMTKFCTGALAVALVIPSVSACTGMYAGKKVSADGTILIGRTVDTPPWSCCFRAVRVPRGEGVKYAYVCTPAVTAVGKGFFPSACANEAGLVVSGTVTGHTRKEILELDPKTNKKGVGEFNMPGLVAANCANAREALDYFSKVIAERGHFGSEIYMFADKDEAWYLEVYSGHQWAAVKMPEDKVACFGNQFMIRSFDPDSPDVRHSQDLISMPEKAGLLVRGDDGLPDLCLTYATPLGDYSNFRTWFGHKTFSPCTAGVYETKRPMPLFYSPARKVSIDDMFELMRSRFEGTDMCPDEGGSPKVRTIGTTKQATSHVISLDHRLPAKFAGTVWFSLANAEHSVFLPMNAAVTETNEAFSQDDVEKPFSYNPALAGHAFRRLCALAEQNRRFYGRGVRAWWRARERELIASYSRVLAEAVAKDDASIVTDFAKREQTRALKDARRIFDELMWYVMENNRIEGDGSGATTLPEKPFRPKGLGYADPADLGSFSSRRAFGTGGGSCRSGNHGGKHALAQAAAKKLISLFAAYERSGVKDECFGVEPNFIYGAIHVGQLLANVDGLIVKHHSYDIETGVIVRIEETAGFVDEYTQFLLIAFHAPHKRKRRKSLPATSTGTFPRIQAVPVFQPSPTCMIANFLAWRKGARGSRTGT